MVEPALVPEQPWLLPHAPLATAADILACFRLILGRSPNREECAGHFALAGQQLGAVVANYVNSAEFAARGVLQRRPADDVRLIQLADYRIYAPTSDPAVGHHVANGVYEPHVAAVLRRVLRPGMGMLDLGANIGVFALLAAALVGSSGHVLAMEPNPANARLLEASRLANGFAQLTVCQAAAGAQVGVLALNTFDTNGTVTTAPEAALLTAQTVPVLPADCLLGERRIDLVKIDVEGAEFLALSGASAMLRRCRPVIVSEFSPGQMPGISGIDGPGYLRFLQGFGYRLGVLGADGGSTPGLSVDQVMAAYEAAAVDHIDIVAVP